MEWKVRPSATRVTLITSVMMVYQLKLWGWIPLSYTCADPFGAGSQYWYTCVYIWIRSKWQTDEVKIHLSDFDLFILPTDLCHRLVVLLLDKTPSRALLVWTDFMIKLSVLNQPFRFIMLLDCEWVSQQPWTPCHHLVDGDAGGDGELSGKSLAKAADWEE